MNSLLIFSVYNKPRWIIFTELLTHFEMLGILHKDALGIAGVLNVVYKYLCKLQIISAGNIRNPPRLNLTLGEFCPLLHPTDF